MLTFFRLWVCNGKISKVDVWKKLSAYPKRKGSRGAAAPFIVVLQRSEIQRSTDKNNLTPVFLITKGTFVASENWKATLISFGVLTSIYKHVNIDHGRESGNSFT